MYDRFDSYERDVERVIDDLMKTYRRNVRLYRALAGTGFAFLTLSLIINIYYWAH